MVTYRLAHWLLALAVRRWPGPLRAELYRECSAELQVLAADGHHWRMLRYAASLAAARPSEGTTTVAALLPGLWRVVRLTLVAPVLAIALPAVGVMVGGSVLSGPVPFGLELQTPMMTLASLGVAVLLGWLGRRWTIAGAWPPLLLPAVTLPGFALLVLLDALTEGRQDKVGLHGPGYALFFLGLGAVLAVAARLARAGRIRWAWSVGILGALVVADVAVMLPLLGSVLSPEQAVDAAYAPVWLFTSLTDSGFGLPHPTGIEIFTIGDVVEFDSWLYIAFTGFALGAVLGATRQRVPAVDAGVEAAAA